MGILTTLQAPVYLDTNVWIYALEGYPALVQPLTELFTAIDRGDISAVTSELTLAEVLVKPFMDGSPERQAAYQQVIRSTSTLQVFPVSREILVEAAKLRATAQLKLPDAIHVATALLTQCSTFLTNDRKLQSIPNLPVFLLSEIFEEEQG